MSANCEIFQCGDCLRYFIAGAVVALSIGEQAAAARAGQIAPLDGCGLADCAGIQAARLERGKQYLQRFQRGGRQAAAGPRKTCFTAAHPPENYRSPLPPEKDFETPPKDVSPLDFETSANARLLDFFDRPENFGKWFSAKWLEDEIAKTSGRMNNRAIWLREKLNPIGLELDQHACPPGAGLPNGSYYRLCRIEDALRLSDAEKHRLTLVRRCGKSAK